MRAPDPTQVKKLTRYIVWYVLGILTGAILFLYMYGHMVDQLILDNRKLGTENVKLMEEIEELKKDKTELSQQNKKLVIKSIHIIIMEEDNLKIDGFIQTEVTDRLRRELKFMINLPLESIAETSDVIKELVNSRKYTINQKEIGIELDTLTIYTTLTLKIRLIDEV